VLTKPINPTSPIADGFRFAQPILRVRSAPPPWSATRKVSPPFAFAAPRGKQAATEGAMSRNNIVYLIVGALVVVVVILGYQLYQDRKQPEGVRIDLGPNGMSIEKK
jgi:hypothetical protein